MTHSTAIYNYMHTCMHAPTPTPTHVRTGTTLTRALTHTHSLTHTYAQTHSNERTLHTRTYAPINIVINIINLNILRAEVDLNECANQCRFYLPYSCH